LKDPDGKEFFYHKPTATAMWPSENGSKGNSSGDIEYITDVNSHPLSNFYVESITINNTQWPSAIHYLEVQSFQPLPASAFVSCLDTPRDAFTFARQYSHLVSNDWMNINIQVMEKALLEKFKQNIDLQKLLIDTNGMYLSEHTDKDNFWGDNLDDSGQNWLGKLLMNLRNELCQSAGIQIKPHTGRIDFYEKNKPYYQFTNFYVALITVDNIQYPTSEHYFQGQKFSHLLISDFLRSLTPEDVINFTHNPIFSKFRDQNWKLKRNNELMIAQIEKLNQSSVVKKKLIDTKNNLIVYKSKDLYWGVNDGIGDNILGTNWMSLREGLNKL
jgi:ribA/ribD-fused uncharacterized protein